MVASLSVTDASSLAEAVASKVSRRWAARCGATRLPRSRRRRLDGPAAVVVDVRNVPRRFDAICDGCDGDSGEAAAKISAAARVSRAATFSRCSRRRSNRCSARWHSRSSLRRCAKLSRRRRRAGVDTRGGRWRAAGGGVVDDSVLRETCILAPGLAAAGVELSTAAPAATVSTGGGSPSGDNDITSSRSSDASGGGAVWNALAGRDRISWISGGGRTNGEKASTVDGPSPWPDVDADSAARFHSSSVSRQ